MYKKKGNLVILSVAFLFFIAGCAGGEGTTTGAPTTPFIGGTEAIQIGFLEGSPPEEVTDQGSFPFQAVVSLKNVGEHDIVKDQIKTSLIGFLASQFSADVANLADKPLTEDLKGKKRDPDGNIIEPIETFLTFPTDDTNFEFDGDVRGNTVFIFRTDSCFLYSGDARSELCILQNQIDVADDAICKPTESKSVFSSGSPIQVASFRQNVAGSNKIQFSFDVNHVGKGSLFSVPALSGLPITKNNLVAYWKFDESSGTTAQDSSGTTPPNTGILGLSPTSPTWTTGKFLGHALSFDGVDDHVAVTDSVSIRNIFVGGGTVSAWVNVRSAGEGDAGRILNKDGADTGNGWRLNTESGTGANTVKVKFLKNFATTDGVWSIDNVRTNEWVHLAIVYSSDAPTNDPIFYVNGVKVSSSDISTPAGTVVADAGVSLSIGSDAGANTFDGIIDDVRLYNGVLSDEEIKAVAEELQPNCPTEPTVRRTEEDNVLVTVNTTLLLSESYELNCVGLKGIDEDPDVSGEQKTIAQQQGEVKLVNGKRTMTCTLNLPITRTDFVTPIDIKAQFNYEQSADREVLVKHLLTDP